ncbi:MAG: hypothetical protein K8U03_15170 [Planctomycetia bacterium]|nr:hypothetical protein [Planctomycetia bacterium]
MANTTYYVQECPTCGRKLNVRVEYLGRKVVCQHCRAPFLAWDPEGAPTQESSLSGTRLLDRAQELIEQAEAKIAESRIIRARIDPDSAKAREKTNAVT